jgi:hypothetical protein
MIPPDYNPIMPSLLEVDLHPTTYSPCAMFISTVLPWIFWFWMVSAPVMEMRVFIMGNLWSQTIFVPSLGFNRPPLWLNLFPPIFMFLISHLLLADLLSSWTPLGLPAILWFSPLVRFPLWSVLMERGCSLHFSRGRWKMIAVSREQLAVEASTVDYQAHMPPEI